jgi:hypothetical protein
VEPGEGTIRATLEDNFHRFSLALRHAGGVVTAVEATPERYPWTTCVHAPEHFVRAVLGRPLAEVAAIDPTEHCTHLMDLLVLCAARAGRAGPLEYDLRASDPQDGRKSVVLRRNGIEAVRWELAGTLIEAPSAWAGRDLKQLSAWRDALDPEAAVEAVMMRRAALMADQQAGPATPMDRLPTDGRIRMGACFTYQPARAADAWSTHSRRVFEVGVNEPLQRPD